MALFDEPARSPDEAYESVRTHRGYRPARLLMEEVFSKWPGAKTEFINDFRGRGFSARVWELALFAYLVERDLVVDMSERFPDFVVDLNGLPVAIEATTTNPRADTTTTGDSTDEPDSTDRRVFQFGKALRRKVTKQFDNGGHYWDAPHVEGMPFVLAVEAFHDESALAFSETTLASYLYGLRWTSRRSPEGRLIVEAERVLDHTYAGRSIPSAFFFQQGMENVSAVMFSNSATVSQFERIGIEVGYGTDGVKVWRTGLLYDHDPDSSEPRRFGYEVTPGERRETFASGLRILHNPRAAAPIPLGAFPDIVEMTLGPDMLVHTTAPQFAPFSSQTVIVTTSTD